MKNKLPDDVAPIVAGRSPSSSHVATASDSPDVAPTSQPPKLRKKLVVLILAGVLVVLGAMVAVYVLFLQKSAQQAKVTDPLAAATRFDSPQALLDAVEPSLEGIRMVTPDESNGMLAIDADGYAVYGAPIYKVEGKKFSNLPEKANGVGYTGNSENAKNNYASLVEFFKGNKFRQIIEKKNVVGVISTNDTGMYISYAEYESPDMLCVLRHADASGTKLDSHIASLGCASKKSYAAAAEKLQPFYDAYTDEDDEDAKSDLVFGSINQSAGMNGYERAVVYQRDEKLFKEEDESLDGSLSGYYFKQPNDEKWSYFTGIQAGLGPLDCSQFDADDLKKAFSGLQCFDTNTRKESTVK